MAAKWPENGATEERLRDSTWRFGEIRRRSTSLMAQVRMAKVGAPLWYLRRSQWLPKKRDPASYSKKGEGFGVRREKVERREKGPKFHALFVLYLGFKTRQYNL